MTALKYLSIIVIFKDEAHAKERNFELAQVFNGFRGINNLHTSPFDLDKQAGTSDDYPVQAALFLSASTADSSLIDCAKFRQDIGYGFAAIVQLSEIVKEN